MVLNSRVQYKELECHRFPPHIILRIVADSQGIDDIYSNKFNISRIETLLSPPIYHARPFRCLYSRWLPLQDIQRSWMSMQRTNDLTELYLSCLLL